MSPLLKNILHIYRDLKKDPERYQEIEEYSLLLHNELEEEFKKELPVIYDNYHDLKKRSENLISRGYKFEVKGDSIRIVSPHPKRMDINHKIYNPKDLLYNLMEDPLSEDEEEISQLFLSNENAIIYLNLAINLF